MNQPSLPENAVSKAAQGATSTSRMVAGSQSSEWQGLTEQQQLRLSEILDDCLVQYEGGQPIDEDAVVAKHPDLADPLREYFDSIRYLYQAATGYRPDPTEHRSVSEHWQTVGDYRIIREIGRGGMGVVYEAQSKSLLRRVALKLLPFKSLLDEKQVARFRNEAQAAGQLHHPHIVPVYAVGCDRGVHYLAMQYIAGQSVDVVIAEMRHVAATNGTLSGITKDDHAERSTVGDPPCQGHLALGDGLTHASTPSQVAQPRASQPSDAQ